MFGDFLVGDYFCSFGHRALILRVSGFLLVLACLPRNIAEGLGLLRPYVGSMQTAGDNRYEQKFK